MLSENEYSFIKDHGIRSGKVSLDLNHKALKSGGVSCIKPEVVHQGRQTWLLSSHVAVAANFYVVTASPSYGIFVDLKYGGSDYHFSWRHEGAKQYNWGDANNYCSSLGNGWYGISIESYLEDRLISSIIGQEQLNYIWTGGFRSGYTWLWPSRQPLYGINWSYIGKSGLPQPGNRKDGQEFCPAVRNSYYNDGIKWHDVACHHKLPIICERPSE